MSLPQDSNFEACYKCNTAVSTAEIVKCDACLAPYHNQCIDKDEKGKVLCVECRKSNKPESIRSKSVHSVRSGKTRSSASSSSSAKLQLKLNLLEEKQKLLNAQYTEMELHFKEKHRLQNEIMNSKINLLKETNEEFVAEDENIIEVNEKVSSWLDGNGNKESEPQIAKYSLVRNQINENHFSSPVVNVTGNADGAGITYKVDASAPPKLSSTRVNNNLQAVQHAFTPNLRIDNDAFDLHMDSSVIATRQVIDKRLPEFNGNPLKWPTFISQYETSTKYCKLNNAENLLRLSQSLKGDAFKAVEKLLYIPDNVPTIIEILNKIFGRPEFIINSMLDDIRSECKPKYECFDSIIAFSLQVTNLCATMKTFTMSNHLWNPILLQELVEKLPSQLKYDWALFKASHDATNLEVFNGWLESRAVSLTSVLTKPPQLSKISKPSKGYVNVHSDEKSLCVICLKDCTEIPQCPVFCDASYSCKWKFVKDHNLCRICLKAHTGRCHSGRKCEVANCPYKHNTLLHKPADNPEVLSVHEQVNVHNETSSSTLFKVLPVRIYGLNNNVVSTFAFLDEGSSVTLLDNSIAEELQLRGTTEPLCLKWTKDRTVTDYNSKKVSIMIEGLNNSPKRFRLENVRTVCDLNLPKQTMDFESLSTRYSHLRNIPVKSFSNIVPRILIGLDNVRICSTHKSKVGKPNEPIASKTALGWSVFGSMAENKISEHSFHLCECNELSAAVKQFVTLDNMDIKDVKTISKIDQKILSSMEKSITFREGKYSCGLLWRYENMDLPESYQVAKQRADCLLKRFQRDPSLHQMLDEMIQAYETKGYIRKLSNDEVSTNQQDHWYLPIFPVVNPNKPSKIRLVWDAAAKSHNVSLNDLLNKGPDLLNSLPAILLRFREKRIALAGDIMEMFHQIGIIKSEQKYHWFLWQKQNETSMSKYAMTVMSFGAACSPCISQFVKNYHALKYENIHPKAVNAITRNIYVDDWLDSFDTENEALSVSSEVFNILRSGGFNMRNWISNSDSVIKTMGCLSSSSKKISERESEAEKVLGMWWDTTTDSFLFTLKFNKGNQEVLKGHKLPTKREVLRILMSIYDPLGLVAHITVYSKILLQQIWLIKLQWDDEIPENMSSLWQDWISMLNIIQDLRIPRWYSQGLQNAEYEIHIFVDGSEQAYAAVAYIVCRCDEKIVCKLVSAKTRTAPLKPLSIPRLELQSAVLGSRLAKFVTENSNINFKKRVFWTDSKTVMCWLQSEPRKFKQFVSCRIGEILESCEVKEWTWVPTNLNPADIATRMRMTTDDINNVGYNGPSFLYSTKGEHDYKVTNVKDLSAELELRPQTLFHHREEENLLKIEQFSSYRKLRRRCYFIIRCFFSWKEKALKLPVISSDDNHMYELAENMLFRQAQNQVYVNELLALSSNCTVEKSSSLFKLSPYIDERNVIRVRGRIDYAPDALQSTKRPVILPPKHPISRLIIDHYHRIYKHQNHETVVNEIRQKFSISRLRTELKKVINLCQYCKNRKAVPSVPEMAPLPPARLSSFTRPFTFSGIDYFGPVVVINGRKNEKRWCLLATCLTIRAIHIEIVNSLSTSSCILALRNFFNRRGRPKEIYCDNGTNFRGASRELKNAILSIDVEQVKNEFVDYDIKWCFNPPSSPHMGGSWERLIRSIKSNLQSITSSKSFHEEILRSFLIEIESIINSRPLTYIPIENENAEAITPNHFLLGTSSGNKPIGEFSDDAYLLRKNWSTSQKLTNIFWKRWIKEYLPTLTRRTKWFNSGKPVQVGDIVIVFEDNMPRSCYPKGKIIDAAFGRDANVRKVTVKTAKGIYIRPVSKIAVLDVMERSVATPSMQHGGGEMLERDPVENQNNQ